MTTTARTQYRINPNLKANAEKVLMTLGIKPAQAITMFYTEIARTGTLPFTPTKVPNEELQKAMKEAEDGDVVTYKNMSEMFEDLNS